MLQIRGTTGMYVVTSARHLKLYAFCAVRFFKEKYKKKPVLLLFSGTLHEDYLRELLTTLGDRFSQEDVDDLYKVV